MADKAELTIDSKERVAYDLMSRIATQENSSEKDKFLKPDARTYYLTLYRQCLKASEMGFDMKEVLSAER